MTHTIETPTFQVVDLETASASIINAARRLVTRLERPILVVIDGGSGSGKSTIGKYVAEQLDATFVQGDDFYSAHIPDSQWDMMSVQERYNLGIDWRRIRTEVLIPLLAGRQARWHAFDFLSGLQEDGTYKMCTEFTVRDPKKAIVLDCTFSFRPELEDLVDLSVLVDIPVEERHRRTDARESQEFLARWHTLWDPVEEHYFGSVRPAKLFDLVVRM